MLIPRYSLSRMLLIVTGMRCGKPDRFLRPAGTALATLVSSLALATLALCLLIYAYAFLVAYGLAAARASRTARRGISETTRFVASEYPFAKEAGSPFATADEPPPQLIPKIDSDSRSRRI